MKTYFVISDIHSYATAMIKSLTTAGFQRTNKDHILIVCGDLFDRGDETLEVYNYIKSLPKNRRILIKGNHEHLFLDLLLKPFPEAHDFSNGTVLSFCQIAKVSPDKLTEDYWKSTIDDKSLIYEKIQKDVWQNEVRDVVAQSEITKWLLSDEWINYYELKNFIFVHSFIPLKLKEDQSYFKLWPAYYVDARCFEFKDDWRDAADFEWEDASWMCPWKCYNCNLFEPEANKDKILVCGHWHARNFHKIYENTNLPDDTIFYSKNLIALDACTALSNTVNVLVIKDNLCFDKFGKKLDLSKPATITEKETDYE